LLFRYFSDYLTEPAQTTPEPTDRGGTGDGVKGPIIAPSLAERALYSSVLYEGRVTSRNREIAR